MKYYLGIDGGGTKTVAAVADEKGIILKKEGKTINFYSVGMDAARKNLACIIDDIARESRIDSYEGAFIGCSALDGEADDETVAALCGGVINAAKIGMNSDVYIALRSVGDVSCPCAAICGTGSMAIGKDIDGNIHITGGWGHIIGDEGSAYSLALNALKRCCQFCDKEEETPIIKKALEFFKINDFREAIDIVYSPDTTKEVIASFAGCVGELAAAGDPQAMNIVVDEAVRFAQTVIVLLKKIASCDRLGIYGGVFANNEAFTESFCKQIRAEYPELEIQFLDIPPEESALKLAREL